MSSKDKESFNKFKQELKATFKNCKTILANPQTKQKDELPLPPEIEADICSTTPISQRITAIKNLGELVLLHKLEEYALEKVCIRTEDILRSSIKEHRYAILHFYQCLIQGQYNYLGIMRSWFFHVVRSTEYKEDVIPKFELFQKLTENGKDLTYFEEEVGPFLMYWLQDILAKGKTLEFLQVLVNYIKYNAAYIDDEVLNDIVQYTAFICINSSKEDVVKGGLNVLDTVICYSNISQQTITVFISALSKCALLETYNAASWKIMRNLLGTHMGHFCLRTMCKLLQDDKSYDDPALVIGTHFFINMALLHNKPDFIIGYIPSFILPSFEKTAESSILMVMNEVCAGFKWLIEKYGKDLTFQSWERIILTLNTLVSNIDKNRRKHEFESILHEIFMRIEVLFETDQYRGDPSDFYRLAYQWHLKLPEPVIIRLLNYSAKFIIPLDEEWIENLRSLMDNFYDNEFCPNLRIHMLNIFEDVLMTNRYLFEKVLIDDILTPFFSNIPLEKDPLVRKAVIEFLLRFSLNCSNIYMEPMLDIIEKVLQAPFQNNEIAERYEKDSTEIEITLKGLVNIFVVTIYQLPSSNAIKVLSMLVAFLQNHYKQPNIFESVIDIRLMVAECLLKLRVDSRYRLGYCSDMMGLKFSSFLVVEHRRPSNVSLSALSSIDSRSSVSSSFEDDNLSSDITYIYLSDACQAVVTVLRNELDWRVLKPVLQGVPTALKYKALIISRNKSDIEPLVEALISMFVEGNLPENLKNAPSKFTKPDFYSSIMPVLSAFASHYAHLESKRQQSIIRCLEIGLVHKSASRCVTALMICLLEMKEAMVGVIREVILNLSKISATKHVAIPILEFLSLLASSPTVFANFTSKQYMSIFAIIFPYTNPFKYHHFTVSLAHHVIATWFFKCRRPLRQDFVKFIIRGLRRNACFRQFDFRSTAAKDTVNEDSSNRKRSSSLTEQGNRKKESHMGGNSRLMTSAKTTPYDQKRNENLILFHRELTDTCIDLMSRVTFKACPAIPRRDDFLSQYLFGDGQTSTWIVGMSLVSITVTGCTLKPYRNGLCERCCTICVVDPAVFGISKFYPDILRYNPDEDVKQNESFLAAAAVSAKISENIARQQNSSINQSSSTSPLNSNSNVSANGDDENTNERSVKKESPLDELDTLDQCVCWCQNWAEIHIRRPTGDMNWVMRSRNDVALIAKCDPFTDVNALYQSSVNGENETDVSQNVCTGLPEPLVELTESKIPLDSTDTVSKEDDPNDLTEAIAELRFCQEESMSDQCCQGRNPVRRSNSSPEMSSNWKNTYMKDSSRSFTSSPVNELEPGENTSLASESRKTGKCYQKELRGNCEAIPEEFSGQGTTPPKYGTISVPSMLDKEAGLDISSSSSHHPSSEKSPGPSSFASLVPSFSFEDVNSKSDERRIENRFFDKQSMPNEHFEFNRSASVSQVVPPFKKSPPIASSITSALASSQPHLTTKPPLSPPTFVSKYQKFSKDSSSVDSSFSQLNQDYKRSRVHTISVMSSTKKPQTSRESSKNQTSRGGERKKPALSPSSVFLQLYHACQLNTSPERPLLIPETPALQKALNIFDLIPPYETYKVGVIYVGPDQTNNEAEILRNTYGSIRYHEFTSNLGTLITLAEENPQITFLGGLEQEGNDGKYAYVWKDDVMQVIFHIATLMPTKENDVNCNNKKQHIGNDYVTIVYNDSGEEYDLHTLKCQFNFACVIIEPLEHGTNQLTVKARPDLKELIGDVEMKIVSDDNVALLARQLALHINLASVILCKHNKNEMYASNWLERHRKIKHIKSKVLDELKAREEEEEPEEPEFPEEFDLRNDMRDFTEFTP